MPKLPLSIQNPTEMPFNEEDISILRSIFKHPKVIQLIQESDDSTKLAFNIIPDIFSRLSNQRQKAVTSALDECRSALTDKTISLTDRTLKMYQGINAIKDELVGHNNDLVHSKSIDMQNKLDLMKNIHTTSSQQFIKNFTQETPELAQKLFPNVYNRLNPDEQAHLCKVVHEYKLELRNKGDSSKIWESLDIIKPHHHGRIR